MALNLEVSNKAPALPIELTPDLMDAFEIISDAFGSSVLGQASMKAMQCLPIAWACLAVKESSSKSKHVRNKTASKCYQEIALPGFIKLCHKAIEKSDGSLQFPTGWETKLYYTTLGAKKTKKGPPPSPPKTFMQSPGTIFPRFLLIKKEFTKGPSLWFDGNEVPDAELPSGETSQRLVSQFHFAMYKLSADSVTPSLEETNFLGERGSGPGKSGPPEGASPASGAGTGAGGVGGDRAGAGQGAGSEGGGLSPLADAALRQARTGTPSVGPVVDPGAPVPSTGPTSMVNELAALAAANYRKELKEDGAEDEVVPPDYCYVYIIMAGAWGRRESCPSEWRYLASSDGPPTRSTNEKGDAIVPEDSTIAGEEAIDRANAKGDPVSRRKAAAFREAQLKKAAKDEADKENAVRAADETANKRKRLEVLEAATAGMTNVASSLAKMAALKEADQVSSKRQKKIAALQLKLSLGLGNESEVKRTLEQLLDEEC